MHTNRNVVENSNKLSQDPIFTLSIASRLSGVPSHSIRQYIDKGLLIPFRTEKNRHLFSEVDISRLKCIRKMITDGGLNIAGIKAMYSLIPCWEIKPCSIKDRSTCEAYHQVNAACWEASHKGPHCKNTDCRLCDVYRLPEECQDLKSLFKNLLAQK